ncbi:MAG TPA: anthranilate phosphoribosyltransferase [Candidatus Peribacteria bacterium]|nr:anthranilate phosphoribosyltransferase [Candidatus Peribacteria bacterium]
MSKVLPDIGTTVDAMLSRQMGEDEMIRTFTALAGATVSGKELAQAAGILRSHAVRICLPGDPIDTCGTGGSGKKRMNTSTIASFIIAAAGGRVAKHGNRAAGGRCGSFDVLEGLGATIDLTPQQAEATYKECGLAFLFAPLYHPALAAVAAARKRYGKPTFFNLLGPLCNPAGVRGQLLGTPHLKHARVLRDALRLLGNGRSLVVCGSDGLDEVTVNGVTTVLDVAQGSERQFHPQDIGLSEHASEATEGGDIQANVAIARRILGGDATPAQRDLVLVNAAHALLLTPVADTLADALLAAERALDSGAAQALLERYIASTRRFA